MKLQELALPRPRPWISRPRAAVASPATGPTRHGWPVAILGVPFDNVTLAEAVARISAMIASRRPHYVATANVDFLIQARGDVELRRILLEADLVLCDGTPVLWASRLLGNALRERVAGADLVPALAREAAEKGHRIFLLGAGAGVAAEAAERLRRQHPSLIVCGHYSPPYADLLEMNHEEAAERIREAQPDLLLVSFGCPKQEKWIAMHYRSLGVPVVIGVGASLDFLANRVRRAPDWMQRNGLEWAYRLAQEPRRLFRRYANDLTRFAPSLAAQRLGLGLVRSVSPRGADHRALFSATNWTRVWASDSLTAPSLGKDARFWKETAARNCHCILDTSRVSAIDSTGVALLARWRQRLHALGYQFVLIAPSDVVTQALRRLQLDDHFLIAENWAAAQRLIRALRTPARPVRFHGSPHPLVWEGEVTAENAEEVWNLTTGLLRSLGATRAPLTIDLSRVRFIDSSGVSLMLRLGKWAAQHGAAVRFSDPQPAVLNVLKMTRLDHLLNSPSPVGQHA